jgi:hypothetical protein
MGPILVHIQQMNRLNLYQRIFKGTETQLINRKKRRLKYRYQNFDLIILTRFKQTEVTPL